jgi:hypothetical protein
VIPGYNAIVRALVALLCVLAVASIAAVASGGATGPNVRGTFVRSTATPGCSQGDPCDPPPPTAFLLFTRKGHSTRVRLGFNGAFAVRLAGGFYRVTALPSQNATITPASIRVPRTGVIHPRFVQKTR